CAKPVRITKGDRTKAAMPPAAAPRRVKALVVLFLRPDMFSPLRHNPNRSTVCVISHKHRLYRTHSITLSAMASRIGGVMLARAFAVFWLTASSNLVGA